ncbi:MAG: trypsin-like peptidase domain-containing protein [Candidatus Liptonbacteria bacterium]|nr:trypsin-like peptidase domain-containing protein [Candidatus Liptonbacteria bacterium]
MQDRAVISAIKKVLPAVVSIAITKHLTDVQKEIPSFSPLSKKNKKGRLKIPDLLVDTRGMINVGGGSGFVVSPEGIIVTNKHVLSDTKAEYTIITADGESYPAMILTRDPVYDVAIIKIKATGLPTVKLGDATKLELGQSVVAIGNALGIFRNTVSLGIVSGLSRSITAQADPKTPPQEMRGLIQTDAAINPGNSGGPLIDLNGNAVGINAAVVFGAQNINFAIPINAVRRDLEDLHRFGHIRRPLLGVRYIIIDENLKAKMGLPVGYGALVIGEGPRDHAVIPKGPADRAGIKERDIILECNGEKIDKDHPIQDVLEGMKVGETLALSVLRGEKTFPVKLILGERK